MARTCDQLLTEYRARRTPPEAAKLTFAGVGELDVYNISAPFGNPDDPAQVLIAGRVEARHSEHSTIRFFTGTPGGEWTLVATLPTFDLQDPFVSVHGGVLHLGGVEIVEDPAGLAGNLFQYRTVILACPSLHAARPVFTGPWGMKDIRLIDARGGRLGVFTRPRHGADGRGRIGFTLIDSMADLTVQLVESAPRLADLFIEEEWGGVNHAILLDDGRLGVLGHVATFDGDGNRHYYPMSFVLNPADATWTDLRVLFERRDLPPGESKRQDLVDVIFPGGLSWDRQHATVYCGAGDAEAYRVTIPIPFPALSAAPGAGRSPS
ncbi:MAG: DUF1861 family protein [Candidatus Nanopelagicales bacterium]